MIRRVFRMGNALAVELPPGLADLGIHDGRAVEVVIHERRVLITPTLPKVIEWTNPFIERNRDLLDRLA